MLINSTYTPDSYTISLHDALPISMELRAEAAEALLTVKIVAPAKFDSAKMAADIGRVAVDAYHRELETSLRLGRKIDRKSTRLNSSHLVISYAVFCLKKKNIWSVL